MKVTLLGDSIRQIGYGTVVPEMLGEEFEVYQPKENGRFAANTLRGLFDWREDMKGSNIIHWNNGIWDVLDHFGDGPFSSTEQYVETMLRIARILKSRCDVLIFATTTALGEEVVDIVEEGIIIRESVIRDFNAALVPKLEEMGVVINDLYALTAEHREYIRPDKFHLSELGIKKVGEEVTKVIKTAAKTIKEK